MSRSLRATYRLQLHSGFTFADAQRQLPYLARLGVSHLYLSPILQAAPGSMHGYDVVDHTRISDELGGLAGFESLARAAHVAGLGIVVDVVPNHMAFIAPENLNRPVWELLRDGRDAATADWFDIDWKAQGGRLGLPVLGRTLPEALDAGEITLDTLDGAPVLRYFEHVWPVAIGTDTTTDVATILDRQHYRLASWRDKDAVLNYRRFFEVDGLIAIRVELPEVFDPTHALLLDLNHRGLIEGFRIDHPDGLADPEGYLARLHAATVKDTPVWVEKILEGVEHLPDSWQCAGTTGYDALRAIQGALTDPDSAVALDRAWTAAGGDADFEHEVGEAKRWVVAHSLTPEVDRLHRRAREALPELDPDRLHEAIIELLVAGEVYRAYLRPSERMATSTRDRLSDAFAHAISARPDLETQLRALIPLTVMTEDDEAATDFGIRLQQTWGPVMAKGIEDTTFYRFHRLTALNEVGSDPTVLTDASVTVLDDWAAWQQAHWPRGMTALSTHDTKRSEDVRARILAVAGDPEAWQSISAAAQATAATAGVDGPTAHLVWQTLLGVGDIDDERLTGYLEKALREAKLHTAWVDGDSDYERRVIDFACECRDGGTVRDAIRDALRGNDYAIRATTLTAKLLQLCLPGVPDTYQGTEVVDLSLVDPDNRRPVDYAARTALLDQVDQHGADWADIPLDAEKLLIVSTVLRLRADRPELFDSAASYEPLQGDSEHLIGFVRRHGTGLLAGVLGRSKPAAVLVAGTRAPARLARTGGWGDALVTVEAGEWRDRLTGRLLQSEGRLRCAELFSIRPVVLLERLS